ncbi:MAG: T9SS type A sorting domain-containing protein [Bacteroidales bacterium]|nr:T9SS type A sorting domain-containing protein [Bacteroidales bacterium]
MKKNLMLLLALFLVGSGFAQKAPSTKLIFSSEDRTVVQVDLNGFSTNKVQTPQGDQFVVNVPKMASILEAGAPDLPMLPVPVIIGDRAEMTVSVIDAQYTDYPDIEIAPSKGNISRQVNLADVPFTYGEMYKQDAFWPATQAYLEAPYILRDFRGQNIMVRPFAYNPQTHVLRVYDNLTIEMKKVSDNGANQKVNRRSNTIKIDPENKAQYARRFINFGETGAKYTFDEDFGELLIICADPYMSNLQPLVEWKNQSGRPTTLVSLSTAGGNNIENVKNYVSNFYNDPAHNLEYVLIVGEYNDLTPKNMGSGSGGTVFSDNYIGKLEGNDDYLEVLVGRLSVSNASDADLQVSKIIYFERDVTGDATWGDKGMGIGYYGAGSGHYGEDDYQHIDRIRDTLLHYTYTTITEHHGGSGGDASTTTISGTINEGISIINYCNHGSETSWGVANYSTSNVAALTNDYKLPIVWSVACLNGKFDVGTCFAESWLRAKNNATGAPTGAVGGMFSFVSQPWIPPMYGQDEMVDILTGWRSVDQFNHTFGGASLNGSMYVLDMAPNDAYQTFNSWLLFGDPSMMLRTAIPTEMNVSTNPSVLMLGMSELIVNADVEYGIATLSINGEMLASSKIVDGTATLSFPGLSNVGVADLTILGFNKVTYRGEIEIVPAEGPYLVLDDFQVNTETGSFNFGEEGSVNVQVKNVGVETVNDVTVTLSTESEYITEILNNTATIASLAEGATISIDDIFRFKISNNIPDGTKINFALDMTAGDDVWNSNFNVNVNAPTVEFVQMVLEGDLLGQHEGIVKLQFANNGHCDAPAGMFNLFSCAPELTIPNASFEFESIPAQESIVFEVPITIAENVEEGSCFEVSYLLNADFYSVSGTTVISVGNIMEGFETGNFSAFDWSFEGQSWTIDSSNAYEGSYCAKSGAISHSSSTTMKVTVNIPTDDEISFFRKVSSESNYDKLYFYIDGIEMGSWSGSLDWSQVSFPITTGQHTLKWKYEKDYSVSSGSDCAWIDNIQMPASSISTANNGVENLVAEVIDNEVIISWTAMERAISYSVFRNGEEIATDLIENGFSETVEHGVYTYCVIAKDEDGNVSQPSFVTVNVLSYLGIGENSESFRVYPNPTESNLHIEFVGEYTYSLYNSFGQQVMNGHANGEQMLNLSSLAKGIYLLHLNDGVNTDIQKVIVK